MHHFGRLGILVARHLRPKAMTMSALCSQVCAKTDEIPFCGPICERRLKFCLRLRRLMWNAKEENELMLQNMADGYNYKTHQFERQMERLA